MASLPQRHRHLVWRLPALLAVVVLPLVGLLPPAAAQDEGYERVVDITFPLSGDNYYSDTYFAPRSGGRVHRATDLMADKMVHIHAVVSGEICFITGIDEAPPSYGYMIRLCGDDGLRYSYVHVNNDTPGTDDGAGGPEWAYAPGIEDGVRVERGQWIAYVGDSGNAEWTDPHLHFEIYDEDMAEQEGRLNPYPSLQAAEARDDIPVPPGEDPPPPAPGTEEPSEPGSDPQEVPEPEPQPEPAPTTPAEPPAREVRRLAGTTRILTALELSRATRSDARAVVVVPSGTHAEALLAAPLAGLIDAPIVLSDQGGLDAAAIDELRRIDPLSAYVIGTEAQLSTQVEADLAAAGVQYMARLAAADRYQLSAQIAREILSYPDVSRVGEVILALGDAEDASRAWPDALSASALAARTISPILLTEGDRLPDAVADVLTEQRPDRVTVVGGTAAVTESVAQEAAAVAGGAEVRRLAGATRYGTSVAVAEAGRAVGLSADDVWIATGLNFPDALAAGPAAALSGSPLLLVHGTAVGGSPESASWLGEEATGVVVVGGTAVVTDDVVDNL